MLAMDYRITDFIADPPDESDQLHTEKLIRLPNCFLCYRPFENAPEVMPYLSKSWRVITFGSFNKISKYSEKTIELWSNILKALPKSRLVLKSKPFEEEETRQHYLECFAAHDIDTDRIIIKTWFPSLKDAQAAYNEIDVALDTYPYNGTTTTCEALYMGVPVITLRGDRHGARVGSSLLTVMGFEELIAESEQEFVDKAVSLAQDSFRLQKYRSTTRQQMLNSPLCDKETYTRQVEAAFRDMWEACCENPEDFMPKNTHQRRPDLEITNEDLIDLDHNENKNKIKETVQSEPISIQTIESDTLSDKEVDSKQAIRIVHHMARSGGTIISRCLGSMEKAILLSEVHPQAVQAARDYFQKPAAGNNFSPKYQAQSWFQLFSPEEWQELEQEEMDFAQIINRINKRATELNKNLILRDWTHLDFTAVPFLTAPSYQLNLAQVLKDDFNLLQSVSVRHPIDQWLSLSKLPIMSGQIDVDQFLYDYYQFAKIALEIGFVRYEDFTEDPDFILKKICSQLKHPFDGRYRYRWSNYTKITGDSPNPETSSEIKPKERRPIDTELLNRFARNEYYWKALEILDYDHPGPKKKHYDFNKNKRSSKLPIILTTSVIRSAYQGQSHGGIYIVDLEKEIFKQVVDWNTLDIDWAGRGMDRGLRGIVFYNDEIFIAASDELFVFDQDFNINRSYRNQYFKHCHEICLHNDKIYLSSTGFDSILEFDPNKETFTCGYLLRNSAENQNNKSSIRLIEQTYDPSKDNGPEQGDSIHINNVFSYQGELYISALKVPYLLKLVEGNFKVESSIPAGTHNARPFKDGILLNNTQTNSVCYFDKNENILQQWKVITYDENELANTDLPKDHARQGFGRGLSVFNDDIVIGGSSPATISVYSLKKGTVLKTINLSKDIRNAIHGLEIWPFEWPQQFTAEINAKSDKKDNLELENNLKESNTLILNPHKYSNVDYSANRKDCEHDVIWVVSYPKSGNTWIRFIIANLVFDNFVDSYQVDHFIPGIHKRKKIEIYQNQLNYIKTHWKYSLKTSPLMPRTNSAVYIVRNPLDVIVSHLNYLSIRGNDNIFNFINSFIEKGGFKNWLDLQFGTWEENVNSWIDTKNPFPVLWLIYEDLHEDINKQVKKIVDFLELNVTDDKIQKSISNSSFNTLSQLEEEEIKTEKQGFLKQVHKNKNDDDFRFFNKGKVYTYKEYFTDDQIERAINKFGKKMEELGYNPESFK